MPDAHSGPPHAADPEVLVVGAGPTGLVLALWLARAGVRVRIVDQTAGPGTTSRATVVHARTLEFYRQLGIADAVTHAGVRLTAGNLWVGGRRVARLPFGDIGAGVSAYPFLLVYPQDAHEALLVRALLDAGVRVERRTTLVAFDEAEGGVRATLRAADGGASVCTARYLAGCDGAHSTVRTLLGVGLPGSTYADLFYVADLEAAGPVVNGELHAALDVADFLLAFPMRGAGGVRLVGRVDGAGANGGAAPGATDGRPLGWEDVSAPLAARLGMRVHDVRWFSTYHVHHRVAARFRRGRAFLLGDAAHLHSPVGGQGMNTGIGDAVNLAWKLAAVLQGRARAPVLDTYEPERIAFARRLVATTDRAFAAVTARGPVAQRMRVDVVPRLAPLLFRFAAVRRRTFRTISQTAIAYPHSALSAGRAGRVAAGDRLPWVARDGADNYAPLASRDWQLHVYGEPAPALRAACAARGLALHVMPWQAAAGRAGLQESATYLVRPDGHVGFVGPAGTGATLEPYLDAHGIRPAGAPADGTHPPAPPR